MIKEKILLFIPMYNCEKQITRVLKQLESDINRYFYEIIIVNNRSTDNGEEAVIEYIEKNKPNYKVTLLRNNDNYGLGGSHKVAFNYAVENGFDYIVVLHGDDQGSVENFREVLKRRLYRKYDAVLGARFMPGSELQGYSFFRTFGNVVYNILFSLVCKKSIYDLGSGLNMYKVSSLRDRFYIGFKDNLVFNYCMILGETYKNHKLRFYPISWREEDQVSNVKMFNQAVTVLKLLFSYFVNKKKFINKDHRDKIVKSYSSEVIYTNGAVEE